MYALDHVTFSHVAVAEAADAAVLGSKPLRGNARKVPLARALILRALGAAVGRCPKAVPGGVLIQSGQTGAQVMRPTWGKQR